MTKEKLVFEIYYDFDKGTFRWTPGSHKLSCFMLIGILHMVQNDLDDYINQKSEEELE